jgi:hypothetical protein
MVDQSTKLAEDSDATDDDGPAADSPGASGTSHANGQGGKSEGKKSDTVSYGSLNEERSAWGEHDAA